MRILLSMVVVLVALVAVPAQQHSDWREFRSEADGFSIEMPGTPKVETRDLGNGAFQKFFTVDIGQESYLASLVQLPKGGGPENPGNDYFSVLMKAYADGSKTTLRSSRMTTWVSRPAMEGISDAESGTHLIDITSIGDRIYLVVFAGAKGQENESKATHMRDSFRLLSN